MAEDLGARLVRAGLVTPEQLERARRAAPRHDGALLASLIRQGLEEDAAAGFFVAAGWGPVVNVMDLAGAQAAALARLDARTALDLLALPVRESAAGLVVAMAAPTDARSLAELRRVAGCEVLPTVARLGELRAALTGAYGEAFAREAGPTQGHADQSGYRGSTRGEEQMEARASGPRLALEEGETFVPLVRQKPLSPSQPPQKPKVITRSFEKPSDEEMAEARVAAAARASPRVTAAEPPRPVEEARDARASSRPERIVPNEHARSETGAPVNKVDSKKLRSLASAHRRVQRPAPIGGTLAAIRASRDRDEVVELACRGALTVGRAAVLLALRKGVLKGWDGAGAGLSRDVVRSLRIPTSSPSMFHDVVARGLAYVGAHGSSAADGLFRAAVGSRGAEVALQPITVGGKVVAVLAADDVGFEREGLERIAVLAHAVGEAFERIIVQSKTR